MQIKILTLQSDTCSRKLAVSFLRMTRKLAKYSKSIDIYKNKIIEIHKITC